MGRDYFQPIVIRIADEVNAHCFVFKADAAHFFVFGMGSVVIVYFERQVEFVVAQVVGTTHRLELTWLRDWDRPNNLGDNEFHLAFKVDDYDAAHAKHKEMGCICFENEAMGIYFISDPDNYWLEVIPAHHKP